MASALETEVKKEVIHVFRFFESNQTVSLTEEQLLRFPHLAALVFHAENFSSERNEQGEFILRYPFRYSYFMIIFTAVTKERPSYLFSRLPRNGNLAFMLELYDYLCIQPLSVPHLRDKFNSFDKQIQREYYEASPAEARDTAAEFLVGITRGEYDTNDVKTIKIIFNLIIDILSSPSVFGQRLRYQTLLIAEKYCSKIFNADQHSGLRMYKNSLKQLDDSNVDPDIIGETLSAPKSHMFHWRRKPIIEDDFNSQSGDSENENYLSRKLTYFRDFFRWDNDWFESISEMFLWKDEMSPVYLYMRPFKTRYKYLSVRFPHSCFIDRDIERLESKEEHEIENEKRIQEMKFQQSSYLLYLRNRVKFEKFNNKCNRKKQKYRP